MALNSNLFFYSAGTITLTNGSDIATGQFTAWDTAVLPYDFVVPNSGVSGLTVIAEVLATDRIRLAAPWSGPTLINVPYFMVRWTRHTDPRVYAVRVSDYLTRLKGIPPNLEEVAGQIGTDIAAYTQAMQVLQQVQAAVAADAQAADQDRQAAQAAAGNAATQAATATAAATDAAYYASLLEGQVFDFGALADTTSGTDDWGTLNG